MFRSLHMKLVLIIVLIMISVMAVVGTYMINSITSYNIEDFLKQMDGVFTPEFILTLEETERSAEDPARELRAVMEAYSGSIGVDRYRNYYILDAASGKYVAGSDDSLAATLELTPNMLRAMGGQVGDEVERLGNYFDVAIPINVQNGEGCVVGVMDTKQELAETNWNLFTILIRAMLFGVLVAVLLGFFLAKTITTPIERLTDQAVRIAQGDFSSRAEVYAQDEIGVLTQTFNEMSIILQDNLRTIEDERGKLDTLFTHMTDGVVAFDTRGQIMHINPAAEDMLGRSFWPQARFSDVFAELELDKSTMEQDGKFIRADYNVNKRSLQVFLAPLKTGEKNSGVMAVLHDITQQKRLDDSRKEFVANVSHELRTPLTNIKGYTETLMDAYDEMDAETRHRFLGIVYNEVDRMTRLVKDLLTLSRLDYGRVDDQGASADLAAIARGTAAAMEIDARKQGVTIACHLPESLPPVRGDRDRLQQVVVNIVSNAVKYNQPGGRVDLYASEQDGKVSLSVADTGFGIPEEDVGRIFERFYRVDKARSREKGGTGLGLAIAREIVEYHGGTITVASKEGKGTTVTVTLPCAGEAKDHA